jgi:hypothetical protein
MSQNRSGNILIAACIGVGLMGAGAMVGFGIRDMKRQDRYVTVKGLVEREVKADLAVWPLKTKVAGNDLATAQELLEANVQKIRTFLLQAGLSENEVAIRGLRVVDRSAQEYGDAPANQMRFIIEATVYVRSPNVEKVSAIAQKTSELVKAGVTIAEETGCGGGPNFIFTKLNDLKPDMLAEATQNARASASQFAKDSGSRVGTIRQANQGVFSITSRDQGDANDGGGCAASEPDKKVRVVTTVDYYLEN